MLNTGELIVIDEFDDVQCFDVRTTELIRDTLEGVAPPFDNVPLRPG